MKPWPKKSADERAFLRAICLAPDDDAPRLVFADWLAEHGKMAWAELIWNQIQDPTHVLRLEPGQVLVRGKPIRIVDESEHSGTKRVIETKLKPWETKALSLAKGVQRNYGRIVDVRRGFPTEVRNIWPSTLGDFTKRLEACAWYPVRFEPTPADVQPKSEFWSQFDSTVEDGVRVWMNRFTVWEKLDRPDLAPWYKDTVILNRFVRNIMARLDGNLPRKLNTTRPWATPPTGPYIDTMVVTYPPGTPWEAVIHDKYRALTDWARDEAKAILEAST